MIIGLLRGTGLERGSRRNLKGLVGSTAKYAKSLGTKINRLPPKLFTPWLKGPFSGIFSIGVMGGVGFRC
jgi:hypothetical protein